MKYPLVIDGEERGSLSTHQDGLFTVFEAQCAHFDGLLRLSVYGKGQEAYLGVMQPWSGGLYLRRRLSKRELEKFPKLIEFAAPAGLACNIEKDKQKAAEDKKTDEENSFDIEDPVDTDSAELTWFRRADGSLVSHDGKSTIVALPSQLRQSARGVVIKHIDGRSYMLFRY